MIDCIGTTKSTINTDPKHFQALENQKIKDIRQVSEPNKKRRIAFPSNKMKGKRGKSVKFKFKTKLDVPNVKPVRKKTVKRPAKDAVIACDNRKPGDVLLITGNGLAVPVGDGEQVVSISTILNRSLLLLFLLKG